jgi:uncharacterized repeat protein (TIGR01451 family)
MRFLIAFSLAAASLVIVLASFSTGGVQARAVQPISPSAPTTLIAQETVETGQADTGLVYNGDRITYTFLITNPATAVDDVTSLTLLDFLPDFAQRIQVLNEESLTFNCSIGTCERHLVTSSFPDPTGGVITITATVWISWSIQALAPGEGARLTISGIVEGQADGAAFTNRGFINYQQGGDPQSYVFDEVTTQARVRVPNSGSGALSQIANWFSSDYGGTISQDWGDFDRDGYLDLALGSSLGASVYRNVRGRLEHFVDLDSGRAAYGVRWADVNGDGRLELIAVGDSVSVNDPLFTTERGINRVYSLINGVLTQTQVFTSDDQLVRVVAANFDRQISGTLDLIASTNAINPDCPVRRFRNDGAGGFATAECVSQDPTAALSVGDFNNDGYPDLVLGKFPNSVLLVINHTGTLTTSVNPGQINSISFDTSPFLPYDFAWGDYDGDGYLDLAAGYPLQRQARIYHNRQGNLARPFELAGLLPTRRFMTPLAIDWTDFNHDGALDLLVADAPAKVYLNENRTISPRSPFVGVGNMRNQGQVWSARAVVIANNEVNIALSNQNGPSAIFAGISPHLLAARSPVSDAVGANSAAWGDFTGDGLADLLLGAGASSLPTRLHVNQAGRFSNSGSRDFFPSGFGPHRIAAADLDNDGALEAIVGTGNNRSVDVYSVQGTPQRIWTVSTAQPVNDVAAGDINSDGDLDVLVAQQNGPLLVYRNQAGTLDTTPSYTSTQIGDARSVAWYDFNRDHFMDFAVGYYGGPVQVYSNNGDNTFKAVFASTAVLSTTSVAWGDANGDGYADLAVGTDGQGIRIYPNLTGTMLLTPLWTSDQLSHTTSLAWGDWNNDGLPDLAAGNDGEPDAVYANLGGTATTARFALVWTSAESGPSTQVAWGDADLNGYLDLAVSRSDGSSGVYYNSTIIPAQYSATPTATMRYPHNPVYVNVQRPGQTRTAYFFSSSELLSGYFAPTVTVQYQVYSVNDSRTSSPPSTVGTPITGTVFEYSLDGGATWKRATSVLSGTVPVTQPTRGGAAGTFIWNAQADAAISDYALFRVRVIEQQPAGPVQQAANEAVSPPFRVRGTTCVWPSDPQIYVIPSQNLRPRQVLRFVGVIGNGSGTIIYNWEFGDGTTGVGQTITHTFSSEGIYTVTLKISGAPCPTTRPITISKAFFIGLSNRLFLPLVRRNATAGALTGGLTRADQNVKELLDEIAALLSPAPANTAATPAQAAGAALPEQPRQPYAASALELPYNTPVPLTLNNVGYNNEPAISGDGTRVAYWSTADFPNAGPWRNPDGNVEIFLAQIEPASRAVTYTQITSSTGSILGGFNFSPSIDAAGDRIVFFSDRDLVGQNPDQNFEIFLATVDAAGSFSLTQVTSTSVGINVFPEINAAGDRIAFVSDRDLSHDNSNSDLNPEIFTAQIAPDNSITFAQVTRTSGAFNDHPAFDTNGEHIAFISDEASSFGPGTIATIANPDGNQEIFMAALGGPVITVTQVTNTPLGVINDHPSLGDAGGGKLNVAYVTGDNIDRVVRVTMVDAAGNLQPVNLPGENNDQPRINTADGSRIIATSVDGQRVNLLDTINLNATPIISGVGQNNTTPAISADGMHLAFASSRQIYVAFFPISNLSISKVTSKSIVNQNDALTYTMMITNNGPMPAPNVVLTDPLSVNLEPLAPPTDQTDDTLANFSAGFFNNTTAAATPSYSASLRLENLTPIWPLPDNATTDGWINMAGNTLLLHFDLDAPPSDSSGQNNSFTCGLSPDLCPVLGSGKVGPYSYYFNGTMGLQGSTQNGLDFDANTSFTIMTWVYPPSGGFNSIVAKGNLFDLNSYALALYFGTPWFIVNGNLVLDSAAPLAAGTWHLIAVTIDRSTNQATLYVDGKAVRSNLFTGGVSNFNPLNIGRGPYFGTNFYYTGYLDELAIFTRALSAAEMDRIYAYQWPLYQAGYFTSRVMDGFHPAGWNQFSWRPERPSGKELLNGEAAETAYPLGNVDMSGNLLLMHLNEPPGSVLFADTSGHNNNGVCFGASCPAAGAAGKIKGGVAFGGSTYIDLNKADVQPPWTAEFWVNRQNGPDVSAALLDSPQTSLRLEQIGSQRRLGVTRYGVVDIAFNYIVPVNTWTHVAFVGEISGTSVYANGVKVGFTPLVIALPMRSLGARSNRTEGVRGTLDEAAFYQRALAPGEILTHYQRNAWHMDAKYQIRTCATSDCSDSPVFRGPGGQTDTYYSDSLNATPDLPTFAIAPPNNRYFQYRVYLESDPAASLRPVIISTTVGPPHNQAIVSWGGCGGFDELICNLGTLQPGEVATITLPVRVLSSTFSSELINTAFSGSAATDHTPHDNQATVAMPISASLDLSITAALPALAAPGEMFTATFIVTNAVGSQTPLMVVITSTVSNGVIPLFPSSNGIGCAPAGQSAFLCAFQNISPTARAVMTLPITIRPETRGQITITAETAANLFDTNLANNRVTSIVTLQPRANLIITKQATPVTGVAGQEVTYTLAITNLGPSTVAGIRVTDTLPVSTTFQRVLPATLCSGSAASRDVICVLPLTTTFSINTSLRFTVTAYISPEVRGVITNVARITGDEEDPVSGNNTYALPTTVNGQVSFDIRKTASATSNLKVGDVLTFTIQVTNNGPSIALTPSVTDDLGSALDYGGSSPGCTPQATQVICLPGQMAAGNSATFWVTATINANAQSVITNTASVNDPAAPAPATDVITATVQEPLWFSKASTPAQVLAGQVFTYTLIIANDSSTDAGSGGNRTAVSDSLPNDVRYNNATYNGTVDNNFIDTAPSPGATGTINWTMNNTRPKAGEILTITFTVTLGTSLPDQTDITNMANVTVRFGTQNRVASASATNTVINNADLGIYKFRETGVFTVNSVVTYTLIYSNAGPVSARNIRITDSLPISLTYGGVVATIPALSAPVISGRNITWTINALAPNLTGSIQFTATLGNGAIGDNVRNTAGIRSDTQDNQPGNNNTENNSQIAALWRAWRWLIAEVIWPQRWIISAAGG